MTKSENDTISQEEWIEKRNQKIREKVNNEGAMGTLFLEDDIPSDIKTLEMANESNLPVIVIPCVSDEIYAITPTLRIADYDITGNKEIQKFLSGWTDS